MNMDIKAFFQAVIAQDEAALRAFFHPLAVVRWHTSNECFSAEEYIRANCVYPGLWDGEIEKCMYCADTTIIAARVFPRDKSACFHVVSFIRVENDKIIEMDEYWSDDAPPPAWRTEMHIGKPIRCK